MRVRPARLSSSASIRRAPIGCQSCWMVSSSGTPAVAASSPSARAVSTASWRRTRWLPPSSRG
eukprot:302297-Lingulodinium_polyedra.AAC.1